MSASCNNAPALPEDGTAPATQIEVQSDAQSGAQYGAPRLRARVLSASSGPLPAHSAQSGNSASSAHEPRGSRPGSLRRRLSGSSADLVRRSLAELPATARELVELLDDLDTVLELVSAFGGGTWYIPTQWPLPGTRGGRTTHPLRAVLGQAHMQALTRYYGGTQLYIPRCQRALHRLRNARIVQCFSAGVARGRSSRDLVRGLARRHRLTDRRVWDILKTVII